jgi:hypothetical protein
MADTDIQVVSNNTGGNGESAATTNVDNNNDSITAQPTLPFANELDDFVSYNYIFTLSALTDEETSAPNETYRKSDPKIVILRSGGGADGVDTPPEAALGKIEYFIDNVEINSLITHNRKTKQSNATSISFNVIEPYSMGIFLQELKVAAQQARGEMSNYLEAPFLLTVEFKGWDSDGNYLEKKHLRRMLPFKFVDINFNVTEGGSVYNIKAIPWTEQGQLDEVQALKADVKLNGRTVKEILQTGADSLHSIINSREQERRRKGEVTTANEYVIIFPKEATDSTFKVGETVDNDGTKTTSLFYKSPGALKTTDLYQSSVYEKDTASLDAFVDDLDNPDQTILGVTVDRSNLGEIARTYAESAETNNAIGQGKLVDSFLDGTKKPFGRPRFTELDDKDGIFERGKIQVSDDLSTLTFKTGTTVQEIIEEVVILSDYGRTIADAKPDGYGMIPWFRVDVEVYNLKDKPQEINTGKPPRLYVYRVVPYKAHISRYQSSSEPSITAALRKQCAKEYNYIFTGVNDNVLEFDINFNKAFYLAAQPFGGVDKGSIKSDEEDARAGVSTQKHKPPVPGNAATNSASGSKSTEESPKTQTGAVGGGQPDKLSTGVARDFNDALLNSPVDLVNTTMTIWGDPYFITDSGYGNFHAIPSQEFINVNADGTMNYQDSEVHIIVNFRTPFDTNADNGFMDFNGVGLEDTAGYSGIYQVISVAHSFSEGKFTQKLKMIRIRNQEGVDTKQKADPKKGIMRGLDEFEQSVINSGAYL